MTPYLHCISGSGYHMAGLQSGSSSGSPVALPLAWDREGSPSKRADDMQLLWLSWLVNPIPWKGTVKDHPKVRLTLTEERRRLKKASWYFCFVLRGSWGGVCSPKALDWVSCVAYQSLFPHPSALEKEGKTLICVLSSCSDHANL